MVNFIQMGPIYSPPPTGLRSWRGETLVLPSPLPSLSSRWIAKQYQ
jgi:hypothetical protein